MLRLILQSFIATLLFTTPFHDARSNSVDNITAQAWLIADENGNIINGSNIAEVRSIASITKLMTAMVVLDSEASLTEILPKKLYNKSVNRQTLIDLAIIKSDNLAAQMLCDAYPTGYKNCIQAMNKKAEELEMHNTKFVDSTGLLNGNVSTANDLIKLVYSASQYPVITNASNTDKIVWQKNKKNSVYFRNTNTLVGTGIEFIVSKTGWIRASGGCIVMMLNTINGVRTVILLGSKNTQTRIPEADLISKSY